MKPSDERRRRAEEALETIRDAAMDAGMPASMAFRLSEFVAEAFDGGDDSESVRLREENARMRTLSERLIVYHNREAARCEADAKACSFDGLREAYESDGKNHRKIAKDLEAASAPLPNEVAGQHGMEGGA